MLHIEPEVIVHTRHWDQGKKLHSTVYRGLTMARHSTQSTTEKIWKLDWYIQEALGICLAALGIFFTLALISYNHKDTGLFHYDSDLFFVANWAGTAGAATADFLLHLFGLAAYLVVASILLPAALLIFKKPEERYLASRCAALPLLITASSGLCSLFQWSIPHITAGGIVGFWLEYWLAHWAGFHGSVIIVWAALWVSSVIVLRVSFARLIVQATHASWAMCTHYFGLLRTHFSLKPMYAGLTYLNKLRTTQSVPESIVTQPATRTTATFEQPTTQPLITETPTSTREDLTDRQLITIQQLNALRTAYPKRVRLYINSATSTHWFAPQGALLSPYARAQKLIPTNTAQFILPEVTLFTNSIPSHTQNLNLDEARERGNKLVSTLTHFGIKGAIVAVHPGPVITMYEYKPEANNKISKITALEDDLAMALQAMSIRIIAPIPGRDVIGFEIANSTRTTVHFGEVVTSQTFAQANGLLPFIIGVDVVGQPVVEDLTSMPHLLVSGTTGSGKSVGLNVLLMSLLCKKTPDEVRLILVDPKRLEFTPYADIPHLLFPIVTSPLRAVQVLKWVVQEMEQRYEQMAHSGVRNITEYQSLVQSKATDNTGNAYQPMPFIVVMIDELADLMMVAGKEVETSIIRIAQMARAAGIHLILATQRPSVDVVTGIIKVNFPSRMAFRVSSKVDSRTILDQQGAEKLLGKGDLLFMHAASPNLKRVHGPYVTDKEVALLATHLKRQRTVEYLNLNEALDVQRTTHDEAEDELYKEVLQWLKTTEEVSISSLQRHYRIGFNRSARIIEKLEFDGIIAPAQGSKPRKVLKQ